MTISSRSRSRFRPRSSFLIPVAALALAALGACNAIFGIEPGLPGGTTGTGGSSTASTGTTTSTTTGTETTTGSGPSCSADAAAGTGAAIKLRLSGAGGNDQVSALTHDSAGNLFAAGLFDGTSLTMGMPLAHVGAPDTDNAFVVKYDPSGAYLWGKAFGGTQDIRLNAGGTDAAGNVYLTGAVAGTAVIGPTTMTVPTDPSEPTLHYPDLLVLSLDPQGGVRWAKSFGTQYIDRGLRIAVDPAGNSYVAGVSFDQVDFGTGLLGDHLSWWSFFLKLDSSGKVVWAQPVGNWDSDVTPDYVEFFEIAITLDTKGHAIIGGNFKGQVFLGNDLVAPVGGTDAFVASLDASNGNVLWHQTFHQPVGDPAPDGDQWITALTTDPCTGDVYAAGEFTQGIDFGSQGGVKVSTGPATSPDMFIARLSASDGTPIWAHEYGDAGLEEITSVRVGPDGTVIFAGFLLDAPSTVGVDFGLPIGFLKAASPNPGPDYYSDVFLIKLDPAGNGLWGKRFGDKFAQAAFDVAVDEAGKIAIGGIVNGSITIGGGQPPLTAEGFDAFVARFDP
ncbi:MAG: hypothetical protein ABJE95_35870 [Byssovorax sp.]